MGTRWAQGLSSWFCGVNSSFDDGGAGSEDNRRVTGQHEVSLVDKMLLLEDIDAEPDELMVLLPRVTSAPSNDRLGLLTDAVGGARPGVRMVAGSRRIVPTLLCCF